MIYNTKDVEKKIKEKLYSYSDTYYYEVYDKNIDINSLVKIRDDESVTGMLVAYDNTDNVIIEMSETGIHKTYHRYHVYPIAHKVLKYKNHNIDKYNDREVPYQKEKFYTQEEMMKDLFYTPIKSCIYDYAIKNSNDELLFSSEHGKVAYPENTSDKILFSIRNDGKIFPDIIEKGYHLKDIKKGTLGDISKIEEELEELKDAMEQDCKIMMMVELSDLYGAIRAFAENQGLKMEDLEKFSNITKRAFENGYRN
jgi:small nuclear ribonucleoprotein (snRNP)-like protein/phosphoribosyl-ATP pyrophosphohydrolase